MDGLQGIFLARSMDMLLTIRAIVADDKQEIRNLLQLAEEHASHRAAQSLINNFYDKNLDSSAPAAVRGSVSAVRLLSLMGSLLLHDAPRSVAANIWKQLTDWFPDGKQPALLGYSVLRNLAHEMDTIADVCRMLQSEQQAALPTETRQQLLEKAIDIRVLYVWPISEALGILPDGYMSSVMRAAATAVMAKIDEALRPLLPEIEAMAFTDGMSGTMTMACDPEQKSVPEVLQVLRSAVSGEDAQDPGDNPRYAGYIEPRYVLRLARLLPALEQLKLRQRQQPQPDWLSETLEDCLAANELAQAADMSNDLQQFLMLTADLGICVAAGFPAGALQQLCMAYRTELQACWRDGGSQSSDVLRRTTQRYTDAILAGDPVKRPDDAITMLITTQTAEWLQLLSCQLLLAAGILPDSQHRELQERQRLLHYDTADLPEPLRKLLQQQIAEEPRAAVQLLQALPRHPDYSLPPILRYLDELLNTQQEQQL